MTFGSLLVPVVMFAITLYGLARTDPRHHWAVHTTLIAGLTIAMVAAGGHAIEAVRLTLTTLAAASISSWAASKTHPILAAAIAARTDRRQDAP